MFFLEELKMESEELKGARSVGIGSSEISIDPEIRIEKWHNFAEPWLSSYYTEQPTSPYDSYLDFTLIQMVTELLYVTVWT